MNQSEGSHDASNPKVILFVDDNVDTVRDHRDRLEASSGCITKLCHSVNTAVRYLDKHKSDVRLVVIDLCIPNNHDSLAPYAARVRGGLKSNQGQLLGAYLRDKHPDIPYVYLSAFPSAYSGCDGSKPEIVFRKRSDDFKEFIDRCTKIVNGDTSGNEAVK